MSEFKVVATRLPEELIEKINGFLKVRGYVTMADYLRDLIRKDVTEWMRGDVHA